MSATPVCCPLCQTPLPGDAPMGLCPRCLIGTPPGPLLRHRHPPNAGDGSRIGDYELLDDGRPGGMGIVYRARQRRLNRIVALKMIRLSRLPTASDLHRFQIEVEACAALRHENIVEVYEANEDQGQPYYSMAYIEGGDLQTEIRRLSGKPMSLERAARLVTIIARAVEHAHQHGLLHRDLKPGNILLDRTGKPYVSDFGLAKFIHRAPGVVEGLEMSDSSGRSGVTALGPSSELTRAGQSMGSSGYTSPEQAAGKLHEVTTASDIFSLGAILYRLITGEAPFPTEDWVEFVERATRGNFKRPSLLNPKVDADLEAICLRCLEPDPKRRPSSASGLANQLEHWLKHEPLSSDWRKTSPWRRGRKWVRRHPTATALVLALCLVGGLALSTELLRRHAVHQRVIANESRLHDLLTKAESDFLNDNAQAGVSALAQAVREAPDALAPREWLINVLRQRVFLLPSPVPSQGGQLVDIQQQSRVVTSPDGARQARVNGDLIELDDVRAGARHELRGHHGVVRSVAFCRDGTLLVSASDDRTARIWDAASGQMLVCLTNRAAVRHAEFSPDGSKVVTACLDGKACLWKVTDGGLVGEPLNHSSPVTMAHFSSIGVWVVTATENGAVTLWDLATHRRVAEPLTLPGVLDARMGDDGRSLLVAMETGGQRLFRVTDTVPLRVAQKTEVPAVRPPLPLSNVLGVASVRFHAGDITCFQVSPDGKRLATASTDRTARLWDAHTFQPLAKPLLHFDIVNCICFSPDGRRLATSTADRKARVWETRSGLPLTDWLLFDEPVAAVAFSADNHRLITSSGWTWELHHADLPAPAWLTRLAEVISTAAEPAAADHLLLLREELATVPDAESDWAKRLLAIRH